MPEDSGTGKNISFREEKMYTGQIMMFAGGIMAGGAVLLLLVLSVVFGKNKKKLIKRIYGEIQERDDL